MHMEVRWLIAKRIVCISLIGELTEQALDQAVDQARVLLANAPANAVHVLLDITHAQRDDSIIPRLKRAVDEMRGLQPPPPLAGWTIVADPMPNQIVKAIGASITQVIRIRTRFVTHVDEAVDFLRKFDSSLPASDVRS